MKIGVPKEIKNNENRVGLVPGGVRQLVMDGHELFVEKNAGVGIGISMKCSSMLEQQFLKLLKMFLKSQK